MTAQSLVLRLFRGLLVGVALYVGIALLSLDVGTVRISEATIVRVLAEPALRTVVDSGDRARDTLGQEARIIWDIRLPRLALASLVGACLALAGAAFQGLLRNPLADPYIVGTSSGAAFGTAVAIALGLSSGVDSAESLRPLFSFAGALLTMYCVVRLARVERRLPVDTFLLAGVVMGSFLWAFVSFIMATANGRMKEIVLWLMGDLSLATWSLVGLVVPYFVLGAVALAALAHRLNLLSMGEESASSLGVDVEATKLVVVAAASLLTAAAVSVSGLIGFLGLFVPHLTRSACGPDHRVLLPVSAIAGAAFLVLADTASRAMSPVELPVGVLTALFGGPFFFVLLRRRLSQL